MAREAPASVPPLRLRGHTAASICLSLAPDECLLASGSEDGRVCLHDVATGQLTRAAITLAGPEGGARAEVDWPASAMAFSQGTAPGGGSGVLYGAHGTSLVALDPRSAEPVVARWGSARDEVAALAVHPAGTFLAAADDAGEVHVFDLRELGRDLAAAATSGAAGHSGTYCGGIGSTLRPTRPLTGARRPYRMLRSAHSSLASAVLFRAAGQRPWELITGGLDACVRRWDFSRGRCLACWAMGDEDGGFPQQEPAAHEQEGTQAQRAPGCLPAALAKGVQQAQTQFPSHSSSRGQPGPDGVGMQPAAAGAATAVSVGGVGKAALTPVAATSVQLPMAAQAYHQQLGQGGPRPGSAAPGAQRSAVVVQQRTAGSSTTRAAATAPPRMHNPPFVHCLAAPGPAACELHPPLRHVVAVARGDGGVAILDVDAEEQGQQTMAQRPQNGRDAGRHRRRGAPGKGQRGGQRGGQPHGAERHAGHGVEEDVPLVCWWERARGCARVLGWAAGGHTRPLASVTFLAAGGGRWLASGGEDRRLLVWDWSAALAPGGHPGGADAQPSQQTPAPDAGVVVWQQQHKRKVNALCSARGSGSGDGGGSDGSSAGVLFVADTGSSIWAYCVAFPESGV